MNYYVIFVNPSGGVNIIETDSPVTPILIKKEAQKVSKIVHSMYGTQQDALGLVEEYFPGRSTNLIRYRADLPPVELYQ